jgi:hypothetical protein
VLLPRVALGKRGAVAVDQVAVQIKGVSRERCAVHAGRNDSLVAGWRLASLRQAANDARAQHTPPDGATDHRGTKVPRGPAASRGDHRGDEGGHANLGITSVYLQGIDTEEIVSTLHRRPAPTVSATAALSHRL